MPAKLPATLCPPRLRGPVHDICRRLRELASQQFLANQQQPFQPS